MWAGIVAFIKSLGIVLQVLPAIFAAWRSVKKAGRKWNQKRKNKKIDKGVDNAVKEEDRAKAARDLNNL